MEFEQIGTRLEWLDEQQRKNKSDISDLGGLESLVSKFLEGRVQDLVPAFIPDFLVG